MGNIVSVIAKTEDRGKTYFICEDKGERRVHERTDLVRSIRENQVNLDNAHLTSDNKIVLNSLEAVKAVEYSSIFEKRSGQFGKIKLYHGSNKVIKNPSYNFSNSDNDYGKGFYLTPSITLAKEWSALRSYGKTEGYSNEYLLDTEGLSILNLSKCKIEEWISVVMSNRAGQYDEFTKLAIEEYVKRHPINLKGYDVIIGWRADDSFFAFASAFATGIIDIKELGTCVKLANLGTQYCLKTEKAYSKIEFVKAEKVNYAKYYRLAKERDSNAKKIGLELIRKKRGQK